jgi:pimeloyl-ACP methyl ester carboxylesterase
MSSELNGTQNTDVRRDTGSVYEGFEHGPFHLEYLRFGQGHHPLIAFHGYGRKAEDFAFFVPHLCPDVTLYSFNLFGHGRSRYPEERMERNTISKAEWAEIFQAFLTRIGAEKASLIGYSLGGKAALCLAERIPERLDQVHLFAPDGLHRFSWYRWATRSSLFRALLKRQIQDPKLLFSFFNTAKRIGAIGSRTQRFLLQQVRTRPQRKAVYEIWNMHRDLAPDLKRIALNLREDPFILRSYFGQRDSVIPPKKSKMLPDTDLGAHRSYTLPKGHLLLDPDCIPYFKEAQAVNHPQLLC